MIGWNYSFGHKPNNVARIAGEVCTGNSSAGLMEAGGAAVY
jgi:hypothetical protein